MVPLHGIQPDSIGPPSSDSNLNLMRLNTNRNDRFYSLHPSGIVNFVGQLY